MGQRASACRSASRSTGARFNVTSVYDLGFLKRRLEQDMIFVNDLAASDGLNEAFDVMSTFMQESASDYSSETGRMAKLGSKIASYTTRRMRNDANGLIENSSAGAVRG